MPVIKVSSLHGIKCPNHGCPLEVPFPPQKHGTAKCPVSGALFTYEAEIDEDKVVKDANGNITKAVGWKLTGDDK